MSSISGSNSKDIVTATDITLQEARFLYENILLDTQIKREYYKSQGVNWKNPALFKTSICDAFKNGKICKYGAKCWYAHGKDELRYVPRLDQIPKLFESLGSPQIPRGLPFNADLPLEYNPFVPPPHVSSYRNLSVRDFPCGPAYSNVSLGLDNGASSISEYRGSQINPILNANEVNSIPGIVTDTESVSSSWCSVRHEHTVIDPPDDIGANFKQKVKARLLEDLDQVHVSDDQELEWDDIAYSIEKRRSDGFSDDSSEDPKTPTRTAFAKSYHPFGQSYPLNWR